jgi:hypothetical protein
LQIFTTLSRGSDLEAPGAPLAEAGTLIRSAVASLCARHGVHYIQRMSTVAYPAQPQQPSWWRTAGLLLIGLLLGALALFGLYLIASLLGVIGRNYGVSERGSINDWPFPDNGWSSFLADVSVWTLALLVVTVATAWMLREAYETVSERRLAVVLVLTGMLPFVTTHHGGGSLIGFVIATLLVRHWVVKDEARTSRRTVIVAAVCLSLTIASYGLLHPVWVASASVISEHPAKAGKGVVFSLQNKGRVSLTVERINAWPFARTVVAGFPWDAHPVKGTRIAPGVSQVFTMRIRGGGCASPDFGQAFTLPGLSIRYRLLGITLNAPLRIAATSLLPRC